MESIDNLFNKFKSKIGTTIGQSEWININQNLINNFANLTMDNQFIHVDPERALKETPFGSTIAHGFLILSLSTNNPVVYGFISIISVVLVGITFSYARELVHYIKFDIDKKKYNFFK